MIRKLGFLSLLGVLIATPPALAQNPLPPEIQEMIDKVHLGPDPEKMATVEELPVVFERTTDGGFRHKISGFVCPHTPETLAGMMPGMVILYDEPTRGEDISCGIMGRGVNFNLFVFRRPSTLAEVLRDETGPARQDFPVQPGASVPPRATADALGLPAGAPLASDSWASQDGQEQSIYITRIGTWFVVARISSDPPNTAEGVAQARRLFIAAQQQITS